MPNCLTTNQRWDNILKNIEKPIYWSYWYWYRYCNLQFQNIDIDIDIEICLFKILIPILILKIFRILILVLILILAKLDQYFFDFHRIFTVLLSISKTNFIRIPFTVLQKLWIFPTSFESSCRVGENFTLYEPFNLRRT